MPTWAEAVYEAAKVQADIAKERGRGSTPAYSALLRTGGLQRERENAQEPTGQAGLTLTATGEAARAIVEMLRQAMEKKNAER